MRKRLNLLRSKEVTGPQKQLNPPGAAQRCSSASIEDVCGHVHVCVAAGAAAYGVQEALVPAEGTRSLPSERLELWKTSLENS